MKMKKTMKTMKMWVALLVAGLALSACSSNDDEMVLQPVEPDVPAAPTFMMTVSAQKGDDTTRGTLTDNGTTVSPAWEENDEVSVYNITKGTEITGTLKAQTAGSTTTLKGELTGTINVDDQLQLRYKSASYASQVGTLAGIAANCDYAIATVTVSAINGSSITTTNAAFASQQAIVKFTLKNADGSAELSASQLKVVANGNTYTVTPASATSTLYVALPGISSKAITLVATVGGTTYDFAKSSVTFAKGKFYRISVKTTECRAKSAVTSPTDLGRVIGANGYAYVNTTAATAAGTTASGIIAYIGSSSVDASSTTYKKLAIALTDANNGSYCQWYNNNSSNCGYRTNAIATAITYKNGITSTNTLTSDGHTHAAATAAKNFSTARPSGTSAWFLPSVGQWNLIVQGLATKKTGSTVSTDLTTDSTNGDTYKSSNLNSVITAVGGTEFRNGYWASTEYDGNAAWYMSFSYGRANYCSKIATYNYVRAVFAF